MVTRKLVENNVQVMKRYEELVNERYKGRDCLMMSWHQYQCLKHRYMYLTSQDRMWKLMTESDFRGCC